MTRGRIRRSEPILVLGALADCSRAPPNRLSRTASAEIKLIPTGTSCLVIKVVGTATVTEQYSVGPQDSGTTTDRHSREQIGTGIDWASVAAGGAGGDARRHALRLGTEQRLPTRDRDDDGGLTPEQVH